MDGAYLKGVRAVRFADGLCACGQPRTSKHLTCETCRASGRAGTARLRQRRIDAGVCVSCGKGEPAPGPRTGRHECVDCVARIKAYNQANRLKSAFGITLEDKAQMLVSQGGCCVICRATEHNGVGWHVDHDHFTGEIRGVLCAMCNKGLGHFKDSAAALRAAVMYLSPANEGEQPFA